MRRYHVFIDVRKDKGGLEVISTQIPLTTRVAAETLAIETIEDFLEICHYDPRETITIVETE